MVLDVIFYFFLWLLRFLFSEIREFFFGIKWVSFSG